jgi:Flp pilus assembly protein TadD
MPMIKSLLSKLNILTTIALLSTPLVALADPSPNQSETQQQTTVTSAPTATETQQQLIPRSAPTVPETQQQPTATPTIASLNETIAQNPKDPDAYLQRGILHAQLEQQLPAIADYTEVIRLDPNYALAYNNRAIAKLNLRDYWGAYLDYSQVVRILPEQAITYNNRAYARHQFGDCKGAIADLRIAAELFRLQGDSASYQRTLTNLKAFQRKR